jgi:glutathione S-transferase
VVVNIMLVANGVPVLWHLRVSNFSEKARWALDYKRVPHRRVTAMPIAHMAVALALTGRVPTFPVLQLDGSAIGDSTRIIAALEARTPEPPLYPDDPGERRRALELEEFFDEHLGPDVRRVAFFHVLGDPAFMRASAGAMTTPRQGAILAAGLPAFRAVLSRRYGVREQAAAQSLLKVRAAMALIDATRGGGEHLVGDRFSVADLTAAALLAPLLGPPELPYRDPAVTFPPALERIAAELRELPAGAWVLRTYARYRPPSAEVDREGRSSAEADSKSRNSAEPDRASATAPAGGGP